MLKIVLLLACVFFIYLLFTRNSRKAARAQTGQPKRVEDMVRCAYCAVYLPKNESVPSGEQFFCCKDHLRLAQSRQTTR
jgi:hypothetical protein